MMKIEGLLVLQSGQTYDIFLPQGIQVDRVYMGADGQYARDLLVLKQICKIHAKHWGIATKNSQN